MEDLKIDIVTKVNVTPDLVQKLADKLGSKIAPEMKKSTTVEGFGTQNSPNKEMNKSMEQSARTRSGTALAPVEKLEDKGQT